MATHRYLHRQPAPTQKPSPSAHRSPPPSDSWQDAIATRQGSQQFRALLQQSQASEDETEQEILAAFLNSVDPKSKLLDCEGWLI